MPVREELPVLAIPVPTVAPDPGQLLSVTAVPGGRRGRVIIEVAGEVDTYTAPLLQLCLDSQADRRGLRELVVDLEQVTFLGIAGVSALVQAHRRCRMRGARMALRCAGRRRLLRVLQQTGLADLVPIDPAGSSRPLPRDGRMAAIRQPTPRPTLSGRAGPRCRR